jgi:ribosome maturation factor RimP
MNKKSIESIVQNMVLDIINDKEYELYDVEYVKEGPFKYLRIYIDKPGGITIDDCSEVSRALSKILDEKDLIKEQYFLEVSSPGVERPFKTDADFQNNLKKIVEVKLYKSLNGKKVIKGLLEQKDEETVVINCDNEKITIELKEISKINRVIEDF